MKFGSQSEVGKIESILIKHPKNAFISQDNIDSQWRGLNYSGSPDFKKAVEEYENFVNLLKKEVSEIHYLPRSEKTGLDSIYVRDALIITRKGAILCNMGKQERQNEPEAASEFLPELGIPILGAITGEGRLEGGDVVWLDQRTLAVGQGYRTNGIGISQLRALCSEFVDEFVVLRLPHWRGPEEVLHLMSLISPIEYDLAVVYSRLLPVPFREWLIEKGMKLLEVPDSEFETMGCNILALAPRKCIMLSGNPRTKRMLEDEGVEVWEYEGEEISRKGAGGPTCLTRPLLRMR
ncbi:MAG: amidinotransferase [candidate division Zixibacteria bacterium SM23_73_2]|nr:MAG: amidinotransferase [candidate division Zixibacteria bacterium SM23_73_2]